MSLSIAVPDTVALSGPKKRTSFLACRRRPEAAPIPPSLVNSPYLSPDSVFRRKIALPRWPSQAHDEWLRDMVPIDGSSTPDADAKSEDCAPSPTSSDCSFGCSLFPPSSSLLPPSPLLQPRAMTPEPPAKRPQCGSGSGPSLHG